MKIDTTTRRGLIRRGVGAAALAGFSTTTFADRLAASSVAHAGRRQEPVAIEYWHINNEAVGGATLKEIIGRFNDANAGISVTERFQPGDDAGLLENVQTAAAANRPPDIAQISYSYLNYVAGNFPIAAAEDLAAAHGSDGFFDSFPDNLVALGRVGDRQVGTPFVLSTPVTYYNADMFVEADLDPNAPPQSWEEWTRATEAVRERLDKPGIVFRQTAGSTSNTQALIESNGGELLGCENGQAVATFTAPEAVSAIQLWADLIADDLAMNVPSDQGEQAFLSSGVAACIATTGVMENFRRQAPFDLRTTTFPRFGTQDPQLPSGGNSLFVFSQDEARQAAAWRLIEFLQAPENLSPFCQATGYLPARDGVELPSDPLRDVAVTQRTWVVPYVSFPGPNGFQAAQTLFDGAMAAIGGQGTVEEALGAASTDVNGLIDGQPCLS